MQRSPIFLSPKSEEAFDWSSLILVNVKDYFYYSLRSISEKHYEGEYAGSSGGKIPKKINTQINAISKLHQEVQEQNKISGSRFSLPSAARKALLRDPELWEAQWVSEGADVPCSLLRNAIWITPQLVFELYYDQDFQGILESKLKKDPVALDAMMDFLFASTERMITLFKNTKIEGWINFLESLDDDVLYAYGKRHQGIDGPAAWANLLLPLLRRDDVFEFNDPVLKNELSCHRFQAFCRFSQRIGIDWRSTAKGTQETLVSFISNAAIQREILQTTSLKPIDQIDEWSMFINAMFYELDALQVKEREKAVKSSLVFRLESMQKKMQEMGLDSETFNPLLIPITSGQMRYSGLGSTAPFGWGLIHRYPQLLGAFVGLKQEPWKRWSSEMLSHVMEDGRTIGAAIRGAKKSEHNDALYQKLRPFFHWKEQGGTTYQQWAALVHPSNRAPLMEISDRCEDYEKIMNYIRLFIPTFTESAQSSTHKTKSLEKLGDFIHAAHWDPSNPEYERKVNRHVVELLENDPFAVFKWISQSGCWGGTALYGKMDTSWFDRAQMGFEQIALPANTPFQEERAAALNAIKRSFDLSRALTMVFEPAQSNDHSKEKTVMLAKSAMESIRTTIDQYGWPEKAHQSLEYSLNTVLPFVLNFKPKLVKANSAPSIEVPSCKIKTWDDESPFQHHWNLLLEELQMKSVVKSVHRPSPSPSSTLSRKRAT